ncbi:hypothetical protein ACQ858_08455 [Variovorax ureilyticus]|uniref:hypothetical protein n=1 Tax=Variovorax ureilyticus TaxID=1836198 RepID=UPI003D66C78D
MSTLRKVANALSFAHLAGFAGKPRAEGDDPDDKDKKDTASGDDPDKGDDDKDKNKDAKAGDRDQREGESDDDYAKRMKALDDEEEDKDKDAKADDDNDEEMRGDSTAAAARRRERARCAAIFGSKAAAKNPVLAANLAFNTAMTRKEALAVLEGTPAPQASVQRRNPNLDASGAPSQSSAQVTAARLDSAFARANPKRK